VTILVLFDSNHLTQNNHLTLQVETNSAFFYEHA
jgi:hypothetical protein